MGEGEVSAAGASSSTSTTTVATTGTTTITNRNSSTTGKGGGKHKPSRVKELVAYAFALVSLGNFGSAAFIEFCLIWLKPIYPKAWFFVRLLVTRWAWLGPIVACKVNNVRAMVTGDADLMGPKSRGFWGLHRFGLLFGRDRQRAIVIMNHLSWADSFIAGVFIYARNAVGGDMCMPLWKWFLSSPIGWVAYMSDCPFLGYGKEKDLKTAQKSADRFFDRWFTKYYIFPEGGIFRDELLQKSHAYATKMGYPKLYHCLLPKTAALKEVGVSLRGQGMKAIIDMTLAYPRTSAWAKDPYDALDVFRYHSEPVDVAIHIKRRSMEDVDWEDEEKVRVWLTDEVFVEKDKILDQYYQGKGPMLDGAKWETATAGELALDIGVWVVVQALFYRGLYALAATTIRAIISATYK